MMDMSLSRLQELVMDREGTKVDIKVSQELGSENNLDKQRDSISFCLLPQTNHNFL